MKNLFLSFILLFAVSPLFANHGGVNSDIMYLSSNNDGDVSSVWQLNYNQKISQLDIAFFGCTYCKETIETYTLDSNGNITGSYMETTYTKGACDEWSAPDSQTVKIDCPPKAEEMNDSVKAN